MNAAQHWTAQRTVAIARYLRAVAPALYRPRRRIPQQQQPDAIRLEYFNAILPHVTPARAAFADVRGEILRRLAEDRRDRMDAGGNWRDLVDGAATRAAAQFRPRELHDVATRFGRRTSEHQRRQLDAQVRAAVGVPLVSIERPVRDLVPLFAKTNVELIKTVPDRYFDRIAKDVTDAFESGMHPETLAERFVDLDDMLENDARRIARDQIGKLNAQLNQERQESLGVTGYTWRGVLDNRERDEHREREGQHFEWSDPPEDGHPGEPVQCRCYSEPDFSDMIGAVEGD